MGLDTGRKKENEHFTVGVIGLGLIGGSMAMALSGFRGGQVAGYDADPAVMEKALGRGSIGRAFRNAKEAAEDSDLLILCMYPGHIVAFMQANAPHFKKGSVVTDVCGTKLHLYKELAPYLYGEADYIGIHPMAGKEVDGFDNAEGSLFRNTGFIITPLPETRPESIGLMEELAEHIGARAALCDPALHDDIIAYTSDLMHLSATALCMDFHKDMDSRFAAGAFRDCTRVANINPGLWTELFLLNGESILPHLDAYIDSLSQLGEAIRKEDGKELQRLLTIARDNKKEMLTR